MVFATDDKESDEELWAIVQFVCSSRDLYLIVVIDEAGCATVGTSRRFGNSYKPDFESSQVGRERDKGEK